MSQLKSLRLTLTDGAPEPFKCLHKEIFDVVRLQSAGFCTFHVLANPLNPAHIHGIMGKCVVVQQILQRLPVNRIGDHLG